MDAFPGCRAVRIKREGKGSGCLTGERIAPFQLQFIPVKFQKGRPVIREQDWQDSIFAPLDGESRKRHKTYDVFAARNGVERRAYILSDSVLGCFTHYSASCSKPCLRTPGCPWCKERLPKREKGYLCGMDMLSGRQVIVELTKGCYECCPRLLRDAGKLRGLIIVLGRRGTALNAPVWAKLESEVSKKTKDLLPPAFDLGSALFRLWEMPQTDGAAGIADGWDGSYPKAPPPLEVSED